MTNSNNSHINSGLRFFQNQLDDLNNYRIKIQSSKMTLKYLIRSPVKKKNIDILTPPLNYLSFSLYYLRFATQLGVLSTNNSSLHESSTAEPIYFQLLNDFVWGSINFIEFYFWSFSKSQSAGISGMQFFNRVLTALEVKR